MKVFVFNQHGRPLMPTTPRKAKILLREGRAKIFRRDPFTIELLYPYRGYTQPSTLGIDGGYLNIGYSAVNQKDSSPTSTTSVKRRLRSPFMFKSPPSLECLHSCWGQIPNEH